MRLLALLAAAAALPGFSPIRSGPGGGTVLQGAIPGAAGRPSIVYLPPGFSTRRRYPVVYLLHGLPGSPVEYVRSMHLAEVGDALIAQHRVRPFIAVVPVAGDSWRYNGEWTGPWEDSVVGAVIWADSHLPTIASPAGRILAGLSAGGYGAIDIGLRHAGLFGTLESWSGYFQPFRDGTLKGASASELAAYDPRDIVRWKAGALRQLGVRFFLSTGPGHGHIDSKGTSDFAGELRSLGLRYKLWLVPKQEEKRPYYPQFVQGLLYALTKR